MPKRNDRKRALREIGALYERLSNCDMSVCYYCGDARECLDHVPPLAVMVNSDLKEFRKRGGKMLLVPSCGQCNSMLGARRLATVSERTGYLWGAYMNLVEKRNHGWSNEDLEEMGPRMKQFIAAKASIAREFVQKLRGVERRLSFIAYQGLEE